MCGNPTDMLIIGTWEGHMGGMNIGGGGGQTECKAFRHFGAAINKAHHK